MWVRKRKLLLEGSVVSVIVWILPNGQNCQKNSLKECVLINSALKMQCSVVKNTLLQTAFSAILSGHMPAEISIAIILTL